MFRAALIAGVIAIASSVGARAQTVGQLAGQVADAQGGLLPGATVHLRQPVTGLEREHVTDGEGRFTIQNVPLDRYTLTVRLDGFAPLSTDVAVLSNVPVDLPLTLTLAGQTTAITVTPTAPLVDTTSAGTRHQVSAAGLQQLPAALGSRGIESALVTFPGFAQNANGAIHPRGAHNQMTFVIDGLPISDQLTGAFANALDAGVVQRVELVTGNVPAEFGAKVSGVALITSRSGLDAARPFTGSATVSAGGFGAWQGGAQAGGQRRGVGYFGSATAMRTDRFLDQVSLDNLHNAGRFVRGFGRVDWQPSPRHLLRLHGMGGASAFQVANLRSQDAAGQDQRQQLADGAGWASYLRVLTTASTLETTAGYRGTSAELIPSAGDTPVTASQTRSLATTTGNARYSLRWGAHDIRTGADVQWFPVAERFEMGVTSAAFNAPGSAGFNPSLLRHDLTRGGAPFTFHASRAGSLLSTFGQATVRARQVTAIIGVRADRYAMLTRRGAVQPRVGIAYQLPNEFGVARASYNHNLQTPPNENLLLSSSPEAAALAPRSVSAAPGTEHPRPIQAERQRVLEVGFQRALGSLASIDVAAYTKRSVDQQDNNNFFDTGIIFPTSLAALRVDGLEARLALPARRLSGALSATLSRAIATPPFTGGLFLGQDSVDILSLKPFRIDHDQRLSVHGTAQYSHAAGVWISASARYDSGLVANPSRVEDVAANSDFADLLPYVDLTASVPRVRPRTIVDMAAGWDGRRAAERTWSVQAQLTNLTGRTALYNFQSVFVGTRLVQPRTLAVRVSRHF